MRPLRPSLVLALGALLAGACSGDPGPPFDATVAEDLAARADALAAQLEAGDACEALRHADELVGVTTAGRDAGRIPEAIAGEVLRTTHSTVAGLVCEPADTPAPPPADDDADRDEGDRGKGERKGEGNDGKGEDKDDEDKDDEDKDDEDKGKGDD